VDSRVGLVGCSVGAVSCFESCIQSGSESASSPCCSVPSVFSNQFIPCSERYVVCSIPLGLELQARPSLRGI